jgi:hypothetical protein
VLLNGNPVNMKNRFPSVIKQRYNRWH